MNGTLTRALMKYHNDFFKLSKDEQDLFKLQEHTKLDKKISAFIYKELGIVKNSKSPVDSLKYNEAMLEYRGIGKDSFMLNEFEWDEKMLSYANLYEYNTYYHNWQEEACAEDENFPGYEPKELYNRFNSWARFFVNEKFYYANLFSFQIWLFWQLDEVSFDLIEEMIPHRYVSGKDDGKKTEGGYIFDQVLDAGGLESWYDELNDFSHEWLQRVNEETKDIGDKVYVLDVTEDENDPSLNYIFGSLNVLNDLTFKNFVDDCDAVRGDANELLEYGANIVAEYKEAMAAAFEEIKKTPPGERRDRKKRGIVIAEGALDDLLE